MMTLKNKKDWQVGKTLWSPGKGRKRVSPKDCPCLTRHLGLVSTDNDGVETHRVEFRLSGKRDKNNKVIESDRVEVIDFTTEDNLVQKAHLWAAKTSGQPAAIGAGRHMTVDAIWLAHVLPEMTRERAKTGSNTTAIYHENYERYLKPRFGAVVASVRWFCRARGQSPLPVQHIATECHVGRTRSHDVQPGRATAAQHRISQRRTAAEDTVSQPPFILLLLRGPCYLRNHDGSPASR